MTSLALIGALALGYFLTTLTLWIGHWFSHLPWSPLRGFHVLGHHVLYPIGRRSLRDRFLFASGWHDSVYAFVPWFALEGVVIWTILPWALALVVTAEAGVLVLLFSFVHAQFHVISSPLARSARFARARCRHFLHHDEDVNYAVFDHCWDRVFGTFADLRLVRRAV